MRWVIDSCRAGTARRLRGGAFAAVVLLALASAAPTRAATPGRATFGVTVIQAKHEPGHMDPALRDLATYLRHSFRGYRTFTRLDHREITAAKGKMGTMRLPDGKVLSLEFLGRERGFVRVTLRLDGLTTTIHVREGGLFFQAGRVYRGGILVLAIRAH